MRKVIGLVIFIFVFYMFVSDMMVESLEIPSDAIRIRVIPNSNSDYDQEVKVKVKNALSDEMYGLLKDASDSEEASDIIVSNLSNVEELVGSVLDEEDYSLGYEVDFGYNYFPSKEYKGVVYEEGYYKSLLVTLGEGEGDNWWCVLFPPLCLIEADESDEVEYKSFVKEILDRYI